MQENPVVHMKYVQVLRAQCKKNNAATRPPSSATSGPNPADVWRAKWRKEEAAKEAWQREQDRVREAALNNAIQKAAKKIQKQQAENSQEQSRASTGSSPVQEQSRKQTSGPSESHQPRAQGDWIPRGKTEQQPRPTKATSDKANTDPMNPRLVVIRGLSPRVTEGNLYAILRKYKPGCVAQIKLVGTSAWIELYTAEGAANLQSLLNSKRLSLRGNPLSNITLQDSPLRPPPEITSRVLVINTLDDKLFSWKSKGDERNLMSRLRKCGVGEPLEVIKERHGWTNYLTLEYTSWRGQAETLKAYIEQTAPSLQVKYGIDFCRRLASFDAKPVLSKAELAKYLKKDDDKDNHMLLTKSWAFTWVLMGLTSLIQYA